MQTGLSPKVAGVDLDQRVPQPPPLSAAMAGMFHCTVVLYVVLELQPRCMPSDNIRSPRTIHYRKPINR